MHDVTWKLTVCSLGSRESEGVSLPRSYPLATLKKAGGKWRLRGMHWDPIADCGLLFINNTDVTGARSN